MPWFRRSSASAPEAASNAAQNPHLQALKRQARNRLIGMCVLVLAGIGLFAWVLDSEPRQTDRDIVYEIPARGERLSVHIPAEARSTSHAQQAGSSDAPLPTLAPASESDSPAQIRARRRAALAENEEMLDEAPLAAGNDEPKADAKQNAAARALQAEAEKLARERQAKLDKQAAAEEKAKREKAAADKAEREKAQKTERAKEDKAAEAARARALLEGQAETKTDSKAEAKTDKASKERRVVQFGSFSDAAKAAEVRRKVEGTGLKTYTQEIDTPRGKLIRLRVGPFNQAEDAEAAAKKIKALGLPANVLTL